MENNNDQNTPLDFFSGEDKEITLPSGTKLQIREQNGNDDAILSSMKDAQSGDSFINYICAITKINLSTNMPLTPSEVKEWPKNDKYAFMFKSRIHSLGSELEFEIEFKEPEVFKQPFVEDLNSYDWDLSIPIPKEGDDNYNLLEGKNLQYMIKPYPLGSQKTVALTLNSGKEVEWDILTVKAEQESMTAGDDKLNSNAPFIFRKLRVKQGDDFTVIQNFSIFSSREMTELRSSILKYDAQFEVATEIRNPITKEVQVTPLIMTENFFFPHTT